MAPKRKLGPSSEGAGPSRPAKSRGSTSSFQEYTTDPFILEVQNTIRTLNCKIEELQAKVDGFDELRAKVNELEGALHILKSSTVLKNPIDENQTTREPTNHGRYELKIMNDIKERVYTGSEVRGQDGELLKVAICNNGQKITSGSLASAKFEVVVLEGNLSIAKAWPEVGSVLAHVYVYQFNNGETVLEGLKFKDNSNRALWRLGIKVLNSFNVRVQEAISDPFRVLDRHGKASEKPDFPMLEHGVERLKRVGQKRASDLKEKNGINTIKDFLQLYHKNPKKLHKILKIKSESDESWKTMFAHAKKCDAGSNLYSYQKKNTVLFFNCIYEVVGAEFGNRYIPFDKLKDSKKILINKWKKSFYKKFKIESLVADFELQNGQPVPIEHNSTGNSTYDDAQQQDQGAVLQNRQPADATHVPAYSAPDIRRDADQDIEANHNTTQYYPSNSDENASQVQGHDDTSVVPDMTLPLNQEPVNENLIDSMEETSHDSETEIGRDADQAIVPEHITTQYNHSISEEIVNQVQRHQGSFVVPNSTVELNSTPVNGIDSVEELYHSSSHWSELIAGLQDMPIYSVHSSPMQEYLHTSEVIPIQERPPVMLASFILASQPSEQIPSKWDKEKFILEIIVKTFAISSRGLVAG